MSELLNLQETAEYVNGQQRIPETVLLDILATNNNEFKILTQAPLAEDELVPMLDVKSIFPDEADVGFTQDVSYDQIYDNFAKFPDEFVRIESTDRGAAAVQTRAGHYLSAPVGGQLLGLSLDTNVSLRNLIGEKTQPKLSKKGDLGRCAIEARIILLSKLWQKANENWVPAAYIVDEAVELGVHPKQARSHIINLDENGIVERRKPNRKLRSERSVLGNMVRIKQENGHVSPVEIVEQYLSIVLLSSVIDPEFIATGLDRLDEISHDTRAIPYLLKRSFGSTGHAGKTKKQKDT